jgi:hypothetical protein
VSPDEGFDGNFEIDMGTLIIQVFTLFLTKKGKVFTSPQTNLRLRARKFEKTKE